MAKDAAESLLVPESLACTPSESRKIDFPKIISVLLKQNNLSPLFQERRQSVETERGITCPALTRERKLCAQPRTG